MESLYLLIPIAILIVAIAVAIFFWAVKAGQFDDLDTEAKRILFDNDTIKKTPAEKKTAATESNSAQNASRLAEKNEHGNK